LTTPRYNITVQTGVVVAHSVLYVLSVENLTWVSELENRNFVRCSAINETRDDIRLRPDIIFYYLALAGYQKILSGEPLEICVSVGGRNDVELCNDFTGDNLIQL
jgi:hypothetical protein